MSELLLMGSSESQSLKKSVMLSCLMVFSSLRVRLTSELGLVISVAWDFRLGKYFLLERDLQLAGLLDLERQFQCKSFNYLNVCMMVLSSAGRLGPPCFTLLQVDLRETDFLYGLGRVVLRSQMDRTMLLSQLLASVGMRTSSVALKQGTVIRGTFLVVFEFSLFGFFFFLYMTVSYYNRIQNPNGLVPPYRHSQDFSSFSVCISGVLNGTYDCFSFYNMQGNIPSESAGHYERIIALMQTYDCSYEDAERHFQLLSQPERPRLEVDQSLGNEAERGEDLRQQEKMGEVEEALRALDVIPFTVRELRTLKLFFSGNLTYPRKKGKDSFCEKTVLALKAAKRKMKCFKYLSPKRLWRAISRRRGNYNYDKISSKDPSSPQEERAKADPTRFQRWQQPEEDWADDLEEVAQQLATYLSAHKELTNEVKAMGGEGLRVAVPTTMELPQTLQPYLFVREGSAQIVADNVKELAEKVFKVVCLDKQYFALLHNSVPDFSEATVCSLAGYNIFVEMQILGTFKGLTAEDVERGDGIFKQFVIKNRLFKSILAKEITQISFAIAAPQDELEQYGDEEEQDQEEVTKRQEIQAQKSIIRQQDMLYQSMLSSYASKQSELEKENGSALQFTKKRQAIKQSIREEPTPGHSTIHITFRTPTGCTVSRHFHKEDSLDYVRNWIITEEQVQFQSIDASFELYHGYPPTRVEAEKHQTLRQAFGEEESKIRVIIKEE